MIKIREFIIEWKTNEEIFTEIFRPYSLSILRKMYDWLAINEYISERYSDNVSYKGSEEIMVNNPDDFEELMLIDYLCEMNSVQIMQKFIHIIEYNFNQDANLIINRMLHSNMYVQLTINVIKADLSILENVNFHTYNQEFEEVLFDFTGLIVDKLENDKKHFIDFHANIILLESLNVPSRVILREISSNIIIFDRLVKEDRKNYFYIVNQIRKLLSEIPEALGRVYKERFEVLRSIVRHARLWNKFKQTSLMRMAIL